MARTFLPALLLYGLSLVSVLDSQSQTMEVRTGDTITLQCSNVTTAVGHTAWFKQVNGSEPVCISSMYDFNSTPDLHNGFQRSHFEVFSNHTIIFLKITKVEIADCGLYFCGLHPHSHMFFVNSTYLKTKVILILVLKIRRDANRHNTGPDSQRQQHNDQDQDPDALNYAALNFTSKKRKMERRRKKELDPHVVYAATRR
ncbi:T-cell surface glycoprotein CD8 beta chain-like isoform 3-T3 [Salvelinus alpinus]